MHAASALERQVTAADGYGPRGHSPWLDIDWREHQRWVMVEDRPVNVIDLGEGPALLFIHGLAGSWQNWLEQLPVFAADRRVIAVDLPGFGRSPMPREEISMDGYARILDTCLQSLGVDCATVVGNSMGGLIGAEMAIAHPEHVERLVLVSAAGITTEHTPLGRVIPALRFAERALLMATGAVAARSETVTRRPRLRQATLSVVAAHPTRLPGPLSAELLRGVGTAGFVDAFSAVTHYSLRDRLPRIAAPTLIVWGEKDHLITVRDAHVFARLIPDARLHIYADTGHTSMIEQPDRFNADLRSFLES